MKQVEKQDAILKYLYYRKDDNKDYSIRGILEELGIPSNDVEVARLADRLDEDKLIILKSLSSTLKKARISSTGIDYCESTSYGQKGQSIVNNIHIINSNSPGSNLVINSSQVSIDQSQRQEAEKIIEKIRDQVIEDSHIKEELKAEILECISEIETGISSGKTPKFALRSLLTMTSEVSSIGSYVLTLAQVLGTAIPS